MRSDEIVIAHAGLPVPTDVEIIDPVFARNEPRFLPLLALASELVFDGAVFADELADSPSDHAMALGRRVTAT